MNIYYVYAYLRSKDSATAKAGTPYYIGKGKNNRINEDHRNAPVPTDKSFIQFLYTNLSEDMALFIETCLISDYGRKDIGTGILNNKTDGGEGLRNPSKETREKMAAAKRNESDETRKKRSIAAKNRERKPCLEETKIKIGISNSGKKRDDKARELQSLAKKGKTWEEIYGKEEALRRKKSLVNRQQGKARAPFNDEWIANLKKANQVNALKRIGQPSPNKGKPWSEARRAAHERKKEK